MSGAVGEPADMKQAGFLLATSVVCAGSAYAQEGYANLITYKASDFAQYGPANAGDMIAHMPGFTIIEADEDLRGYAAARGNVLIDGAWPTSKREDIDDLLSRIPAASVERIELIRGGAGVDMSGHAVLANVVRRRDATGEGAVEVGGITSTDGWQALQGQLEYTGRREGGSLDLVATFGSDLDDDSGSGVLTARAPDGSAIDVRSLDVRAIKNKAELGADWRQALAGGKLTAKAVLRGERAQTDTLTADLAAPLDREVVAEDESFLESDVSARYERELGDGWRFEALASQQLGWLDALEQSDDSGETERFSERTDTGESIGRAEVTYDIFENLKLSAGVEGAFNFLESRAQLEEGGMPVVLPGSDVRVEERRLESSLEAVWKPWNAWVFEASMRFETSTITQTGDSPLKREFSYPKPRVSADWAIDAFNDLRVAFTREVSQLDFGDFVASASLDTGSVSVGNASLEPAKTSRWSAAWERRLPGDASLTMTWTHEAITDVVDRVLVTTPDDQFDAPGNIGEGDAETLKVDVTTSLAFIGIPGGQFRSSVQWRASEVTDPVTGRHRGISGEKPVDAFVSFTQDVPGLRLNWGLDVEHIAERETKYRFDEIIHASEGVGWTLFAEWRFDDRWTVRAEATDLFGRDFSEQRIRYAGARSLDTIDEFEDRERRTPGFVTLTLRHRMGG